MLKKNGLASREGQHQKAIRKNNAISFTPIAAKSQIEIQTDFVSRRFRLTTARAHLVAELAFVGAHG